MTTSKMPPLENWREQTFAYGFLIDRSASTDYTGNFTPQRAGKSGFANPEPDDIHLLNLNPKAISVEDPFATDIATSQGGGKVIESRGNIIRHVTLRGTTGFLPPVAPHAKHMNSAASMITNITPAEIAAGALDKSTGFYEFYRLALLFRKFGEERRAGKAVQLHYLDFKSDEFWLIEPGKFGGDRGKFTYEYSISFDCIEPSDLQLKIARVQSDTTSINRSRSSAGDVSTTTLLRNPLHGALDNETRNRFARILSLQKDARAFSQRFANGVLLLKWQVVFDKISAIQDVLGDLVSIRRTGLSTLGSLYRQLYSALLSFSDAWESVTPSAFKKDINEWLVEMQVVTEGLVAAADDLFNANVGTGFAQENDKYVAPRGADGLKNSFLQTSPPDTTVLFGISSGFSTFANLEQMLQSTTLRSEAVQTGESIYDVAQRLLGDAQRAVDLIIVNKLQTPFIVADATNKPSGTIAWGESIYVPTDTNEIPQTRSQPLAAASRTYTNTADSGTTTEITFAGATFGLDIWQGFTATFSGLNADQRRIVVANTEDTLTLNYPLPFAVTNGTTISLKMELFASERQASPEAVAFGTDILGVFTANGVDVVLGPNRRLATVSGLMNFEQAVKLMLQTPRGANKLHPLYGCAPVIGRPLEPNITALSIFHARQSLLQDSRVAEVERPKVSFVDGALFFSVRIKPVRAQRPMFFRIAM